jgi:hypothetical protein
MSDYLKKVADDLSDKIMRDLSEVFAGSNSNVATPCITLSEIVSAYNSLLYEVKATDTVDKGQVFILDRSKGMPDDPFSRTLSADQAGKLVICHPDDEDKVLEAIGEQPKPITLPLEQKFRDFIGKPDFGTPKDVPFVSGLSFSSALDWWKFRTIDV